MITILSPELLEFLAGPLRTYQVRLMHTMLNWQMDTIARTLHGEQISDGELKAMMEVNEILADMCAHIYWMTTGKDLDASPPEPRSPHIWSDYWPQP